LCCCPSIFVKVTAKKSVAPFYVNTTTEVLKIIVNNNSTANTVLAVLLLLMGIIQINAKKKLAKCKVLLLVNVVVSAMK